jgi:hypothetical protein
METSIREGATVQVTQDMRSNSKNPVELPAGLKGKIHKIDKDGDALIEFDGHDKKHWVKKVHFAKLELVAECSETKPCNVGDGICEGALIQVASDMRSSSKNPVDLPTGLTGKVHKIDTHGDALIKFDGHESKQWVKEARLCNLSLVKSARAVSVACANGEMKSGPSNATEKPTPQKRPYTSAADEKPFICRPCQENGVACDRCWGSGKSCWTCAGTGYVETGSGLSSGAECCLCDGAGHIGSVRQKCNQCGGSGKDADMCMKCAATGGDECRRCRGRGRPFCKECHAIFKQATNPAGVGLEPSPGVSIKQCIPADLEAVKKLWTERGGKEDLLTAWSIDNPLLSWRLRKRQLAYRADNLKEADEIQGFHGTPAKNIMSIVSNGLDAGRRSGQVYGAGEYFAKCPEVSKGYCRGDGYMLICRLLLGSQASDQALGDGDHIWVPSCKYYVISSPEQVVPLYIVKFASIHGPSELENILRMPSWSTMKKSISQPIPENRRCNMSAELTNALWIGYLHPEHPDDLLEDDVASFLRRHLPKKHANKWQLQIVRGKYTQAKVRLQNPLPRDLVHQLNELEFVEVGTKRLIAVDDAHGSRGSKCFRSVAQFCRGHNLSFVDPCWCDHPVSPTASAKYTLTPIGLSSARGDEIVSKFMSSAPFHNGAPRIVKINAIDNATLNNLFDRFRSYLAEKNKEEPKVIELYHGTNNNILDTLYTNGLQPPSDRAPSEDCPVSGGKGLCTSICDNRCEKCVTKHDWNKCHMYGLGIYLADIAQKSNRYVSQPSTIGSGKKQYRMVLCSVLMGRTLMIEGHLRKGDAMHDVSALRRVWKGELETMCMPCGGSKTLMPQDAPPAEEHDLVFVKGLGHNCRPGLSVHNSEYIAFHPYQCLPRYEIVYEL